jgi:hypothetical protein
MEKSPLVPLKEGQLLDFETWDAHTSDEHKWELWDGMPFSPLPFTGERYRLAICLIYSMGLEHFVKIMSEESKQILKDLL